VTFQLSYLLKFPKSLKITPPARDQAPNTWTFWGDTSYPNHEILPLVHKGS
jgi:hypothetical protein